MITQTLDTVTQGSAEKLAVAYHAWFVEADALKDQPNNMSVRRGVRVWGRMLLAAQAETGIQIQDPGLIQRYIDRASKEV